MAMTDNLKRASELEVGDVVKIVGSPIEWLVVQQDKRYVFGLNMSTELKLNHQSQSMGWEVSGANGDDPIWELVNDRQLTCGHCQTTFDTKGKLRYFGFPSMHYKCPNCETPVYVSRKG